MSRIESWGHCPARSNEQEKQAFFDSIPQLLADADSILKDPARFHSLPGEFCYGSWPYLAGDGPLCLGYLLLGWQSRNLLEQCPGCYGFLYLFSFAGSPLSGSNSYCGYCPECRTSTKDTSTGEVFLQRIKYVINLANSLPQLKR